MRVSDRSRRDCSLATMTRYIVKHQGLRALLVATVTATLGLGTALAQEVPKFPIASFKVDGNSLLPAAEIDAVLKPYVGASRDFGDVQEALEALESAYR